MDENTSEKEKITIIKGDSEDITLREERKGLFVIDIYHGE
jgi:hypothetical protein